VSESILQYSDRSVGSTAIEHPALVLIHGAGGDRYHWSPGLRRLPGERVLAIDLPGHGESGGTGERSIEGYRTQVESWMERIGLEQVVVAGHSMGGAISLSLALSGSERVAGLILVGTGGRLRVHPDFLLGMSSDESYKDTVEEIMRWSFGSRASSRLIELASERMLDTDREIYLGDFAACDAFDVLDQLPQIELPCLVLCGTEDRMTPVKFSQKLALDIPDSDLVLVEGAGHMVMLEAPAEVESAIQEFMKTHFG
jgi:pimeloyl-ACP methyl ester carboxylesterase